MKVGTDHLSIRECCQAHYGLEGTRYECMTGKSNPGKNIMFIPNPDKPLFTKIVDCECACHKTGAVTMATKKAAKKDKKTTAKKAEPKTNKKREDYLAGKIKVLAKENPKRKGSASFKRFELYSKHPTVGAFLKAGGKQLDLNWDMDKGFINFKPYKSY